MAPWAGPPRTSEDKLVAELGAVLLGDRLEIGSAMANHAAYLSHWVELLKESPRVLLQVLGNARKAADLVCPEAPEAPGTGDGCRAGLVMARGVQRASMKVSPSTPA